MTSYSVHFIVVLLLSAAIPLFFKNPLKKRLLATLAAPVFLYILFYDFEYSLLNGPLPILVSYLGAVFSSCMALLAISLHAVPQNSKSVPISRIRFILSFVIAYVCLYVIFTLPWAVDTFPLSNVEAIIFTIFSGTNAGAENFVVSSFVKKVAIPASGTIALIVLFQVVLYFMQTHKKILYKARLWKNKNRLKQDGPDRTCSLRKYPSSYRSRNRIKRTI